MQGDGAAALARFDAADRDRRAARRRGCVPDREPRLAARLGPRVGRRGDAALAATEAVAAAEPARGRSACACSSPAPRRCAHRERRATRSPWRAARSEAAVAGDCPALEHGLALLEAARCHAAAGDAAEATACREQARAVLARRPGRRGGRPHGRSAPLRFATAGAAGATAPVLSFRQWQVRPRNSFEQLEGSWPFASPSCCPPFLPELPMSLPIPSFSLRPAAGPARLRRLALAAFLGAGVGCADPALAQTFSVGFGAGPAKGHVECVDAFPCDQSSAFWKLAGGWRPTPEVELQLSAFGAGKFDGGDTTDLGTPRSAATSRSTASA
jgi:hypothetical protein